MSLLEKLRNVFNPHPDPEQLEEQVAADARGETSNLQDHKRAVRDERAKEDYASRGGGGWVGPG